jgi:DNA-binding CsgD family transcriptional regulator
VETSLISEIMLNACFIPGGMTLALQDIANGLGAEGATLTFAHAEVQLGAIASDSLLEHVAPYASPDRPADPRPLRVFPSASDGFRVDQDDFSLEEIERDPFYQDFLRPRGFGWHACALVSGATGADHVTLTLRRTSRQGPFEQAELTAVTAQLPLIRAMASMTRSLSGVAGAGEEEGRCLFGFDSKGAVFVVHAGQAADGVLKVKGGRLLALDPRQQARIHSTVERAYAQAKPASSILNGDDDRWWLFTVVPAAMMAPSGLTPFISWAVLAPYETSEARTAARVRQMTALFDFSAAEARVAGLLGEAKSIQTAARMLSTSPGTIRNHLKAIFAKTGINRQAELVAIFNKL